MITDYEVRTIFAQDRTLSDEEPEEAEADVAETEGEEPSPDAEEEGGVVLD